ncbi:hypothetical protein RCC89_15640 [Cytophagaceae bacterium ABcell3]|nr:hypothetical protein RCC89_15640 [Cytophagaceae bacterium ABcell3]
MLKDYIEGLKSINDLSGERYYNDFEQYPSNMNDAIGGYWKRAGSYFSITLNKIAQNSSILDKALNIDSKKKK